MLEKIRRIGWAIVEIGAILVALAVLLNIILGKDGGGIVVSSVADNAMGFLQALPAGTIVGLALIAMLYQLAKSRLRL